MSTLLQQFASLGARLGIIHPTQGGGGYGPGTASVERYGCFAGALPGSDTDWVKEVGDPSLNYAVASCLRWIIDNLPEPEVKVERATRKGEWNAEPNHAFLDLLDTPNPFYDGDSLQGALARDYALTGNAYALKERANDGRVIRLWWVPYWMMSPEWPTDGSQFIARYVYRPSPRAEKQYYPVEDVIHFRWGCDPHTAGRIGTHRTQPVFRAIASLNEGATYTHAILKNMGIVPVVMFLKKALDPEGQAAMRRWWRNLFTRDGRGKPGIFPGLGADEITIKELGSTPEKLALDKILVRPEYAICGSFGIHPPVVFLQSGGPGGLDNGGQYREARRGSYEDCLVPMTKRFAKTWTVQLLLRDFEYGRTQRQVRCRYDYANVQALAEDETERAKRIWGDVKHGLLGRREGRRERGYDEKLPGETEEIVPDDFAPVGGIREQAPRPENNDARDQPDDGDGERDDAEDTHP